MQIGEIVLLAAMNTGMGDAISPARLTALGRHDRMGCVA